jgi:hypothetical protein
MPQFFLDPKTATDLQILGNLEYFNTNCVVNYQFFKVRKNKFTLLEINKETLWSFVDCFFAVCAKKILFGQNHFAKRNES